MIFENELVKKFKVKFDLTIWQDENIVWLNHFIVPEKFRGKGIGHKIMLQFCNWLDKNKLDCKLVYLKDDIIYFYQKYGFGKEDKKKKSVLIRKAQ